MTKTAEELSLALIQELTGALIGRALVTKIAQPMIIKALESYAAEAVAAERVKVEKLREAADMSYCRDEAGHYVIYQVEWDHLQQILADIEEK